MLSLIGRARSPGMFWGASRALVSLSPVLAAGFVGAAEAGAGTRDARTTPALVPAAEQTADVVCRRGPRPSSRRRPGGESFSHDLSLDVPAGVGCRVVVAYRTTAGSGEWESWATSPGACRVSAAAPCR